MPTKPIIYAHRGASAICPENTMIAFKKAVELGSTGIECDVQMTKDGVLIICHDEYLERTTDGKGLLKDYTLAELQKLDAGSWMDKKFAGEKLPTLDELLEFVKKTGILLNIELKNGIIEYSGLEERVITAVKSFDLANKVIVSSFNHESVHRFKQMTTDIKAGILYMEPLYRVWEYLEKIGCECAHPYLQAINPSIAQEMKKRSYIINTFTVDSPDFAKRMIEMGVDGMITNYPDKILEVVEN